MTQLTIPTTDEWLALVFFTMFALTYTAYYLVSHSKSLAKRFVNAADDGRGSVRFVLAQRTIMIIGAGVVPAIIAAIVFDHPLGEYGIRFEWSSNTALVLVGLVVASGVVSIFAKKPEEKLRAYPQIRREHWTTSTVILNSLSWAAYLFAYELMFRGFMFYVLLPYGIWTSIAVNTLLYVAVHVPKGGSEAAGAFVYGPILCLLSLWSGTIWIAYFAHLALALGNSYSCLKANPKMRIGPKRDSADHTEASVNSSDQTEGR